MIKQTVGPRVAPQHNNLHFCSEPQSSFTSDKAGVLSCRVNCESLPKAAQCEVLRRPNWQSGTTKPGSKEEFKPFFQVSAQTGDASPEMPRYELLPWKKTRIDPIAERHLGVPVTMACLGPRDDSGGMWLRGRELGRGSFGKVYAAVDCPNKKPYAIKVWATLERRLSTGDRGNTQTKGQSKEVISRILSQTFEMRQWVVEAHHEACWRGFGEDPLKAVRSRYTNHVLIGAGVTEGKYYGVMTYEFADLHYLNRHLRRQEKGAVALSAALQVFAELEVFHQYNVMHCDVKLDNMLCDRFGHIKLVDYDLSMEVSPYTKTSTFAGVRGSISTPEMLLLRAGREEREPLSVQVDVYTASASLITLLSDSAHSPFMFRQDKGKFDLNSSRARFFSLNIEILARLHTYREAVLSAGPISVETLTQQSEFDYLFVTAFCNSPCPQFFELLFIDGLQAQPEKRRPVSSFYASLLEILQSADPRTTNLLMPLFERLYQKLHPDQLFKELAPYAEPSLTGLVA